MAALQRKVSNGIHQSPRLEALDGPRWVASVMIICFHFYEEQLGKFALWGSCWTSFFFMLSGFVLAYVEMARPVDKPTKMTQLQYVRKRLVTVYPTYVATLVLAIFVGAQHSTAAWISLPFNFILAQAWLPITFTIDDHNYMCMGQGEWTTVAWFLSVLVVYWFLLRPLARCFRKLSLSSCNIALIVLWMWSAVPGALLGYRHELGSEWCANFMWCMIKNGPLGNVHIFVAGIVAARVFILSCLCDAHVGGVPSLRTKKLALDPERAPILFRYGVCAGYVVYGLLVALAPSGPDGDMYVLISHQGGLMPVMLLILTGGALGVDPLAKYVFQSRPFLMLGRISYTQYLLQFSVYSMLANYLSGNQLLVAFPFVLLAIAYLIESYVGRVYTEWQRMRQEKGLIGLDDKFIKFVEGRLDRWVWQKISGRRQSTSEGKDVAHTTASTLDKPGESESTSKAMDVPMGPVTADQVVCV
eukprot:TRINITY_DN7709_c0_g2_i1.p1 TRINITY_DN7709_c0_g2~~TRINITY_DN7709_c0_g2_i1.p1  ORF type:complete len:492 (+),score=42.34 TRINITY_DN7709_c0_g2_i1:63-1478(+)